MHLLMAQIYAQFSGTSWLQAGNDPLANRGKGNVWLRPRMQRQVYADPVSMWPEDWSWQIIEDQVYLDKIRKDNPDHADQIRHATSKSQNLAGSAAGSLEMPPGPMSVTVRGLPSGDSAYSTDGLMTRRTFYGLDATLRKPTDQEIYEFKKHDLPPPKMLPMYPNGRMIVDVEGTILVDGDPWLPLPDLWPAYPVWSVPPSDTVWLPSPTKYTKWVQYAAERQMT